MQTGNPVTFIDIERGKTKKGRVKLELWQDLLPQTAENFRQLCTGEHLKNGTPIGYKESCLYQISSSFIRGGDYIKNDGSGGESIYSDQFVEKIQQNRTDNGSQWILSMIKNPGGKYHSLFQIDRVWNKQSQLKLVPFGQIIDENSIKVMKSVLETPSGSNLKPKFPIVIYQCGQM